MEKTERAIMKWKAFCIGAGLLVFIFVSFLLLPWESAPVETIDIWLPARYEQNSEEAQALLAKRWLGSGESIEVSSEVFQAMDFRTTYVFATIPSRGMYVTVAYLGEITEGTTVFYSSGNKDTPFLYLPTSAVVVGETVVVPTRSYWVMGGIWTIVISAVTVTLLALFLYDIGEKKLKASDSRS